MSVREDLERFGPQQREPVDLAAAAAYCRQVATSHYENFPVVSWLLPRKLHQHFYNVYAFCRWSDDLGDELGNPAHSLEMLAWWQGELDACYAGRRTHPVFVALGPTIERFQIPQQPFSDLISAFVQDQSVVEYETYAQLRDYCRRSADPVGRIVLHLCEVFSEERAALSDSVCTGLQLANFWQDVARDDEIGRIYLPREDRLRFGYSDEDYRQHRITPGFLELMRFEVDRARDLLLAGKPLVPQMPGRLQVDIDLFIEGGLEILRGIERIGFRVWEQRPVVSKPALAAAAMSSLIRFLGRNLGLSGRLRA
ncbi:MAG: squalene synthase HpnC [Planctomycetaceae bacterium]|nr:squalene synthase HpnC [Planctomycetaceae bacterium]